MKPRDVGRGVGPEVVTAGSPPPALHDDQRTTSTRRVRNIVSHLTEAATETMEIMSKDKLDKSVIRGGASGFPNADETLDRGAMLPKEVLQKSLIWLTEDEHGAAAGEVAAAKLPGPLKDPAYADRYEVMMESDKWTKQGHVHWMWTEWQKKYGDMGLNSNIVVPQIFADAKQKRPMIANVVIVANPDDAERIAR